MNYKAILNLLDKIPIPTRFVLPLAILLITALVIFLPVGGVPYIELNSNNLTSDLPHFQTCEINFQEGVEIKDYAIGIIPTSSTSVSPEIHFITTVVNAKTSSLLIRNPIVGQANSGATNNVFKMLIEFSSPAAVRISAVSLDGNRIKLDAFVKNNLKIRNFQFVRYHYIRRYLAELIFRFNDTVSNWIMTALSVGVVMLGCKVGYMELQSFLYSDNYFKKGLQQSFGLQDGAPADARQKALDELAATWQIWDSRFRFLQALGPAIGFILTVSSLVEVLHPAGGSSSDLDSFLTGIHVAMISTFLGLLLRLIALEGNRANDAILDRADSLIGIDAPTEPTPAFVQLAPAAPVPDAAAAAPAPAIIISPAPAAAPAQPIAIPPETVVVVQAPSEPELK